GRQVWITIQLRARDGRLLKTIDTARDEAGAATRAVKAGTYRVGVRAKGELADAPGSFIVIADAWLDSLRGRRGISVRNIERDLACAKEEWRGREFVSIRRREVVNLLDEVARRRGPTAADNLFGRLSSLTRWYASRHDDYQSPLYGVNLRRTSTKERA